MAATSSSQTSARRSMRGRRQRGARCEVEGSLRRSRQRRQRCAPPCEVVAYPKRVAEKMLEAEKLHKHAAPWRRMSPARYRSRSAAPGNIRKLFGAAQRSNHGPLKHCLSKKECALTVGSEGGPSTHRTRPLTHSLTHSLTHLLLFFHTSTHSIVTRSPLLPSIHPSIRPTPILRPAGLGWSRRAALWQRLSPTTVAQATRCP